MIGNMEVLHSACKEDHSIEMALPQVKTVRLRALDNKQVMCLVLLDLSAAFDTVDHKLLLNCLKYCFGITETALKWMESYLTNRIQSIVLGDIGTTRMQLTKADLLQSIPQGSTVGPILFILSLSPLGDICRKCNVSFHSAPSSCMLVLSLCKCE